MIAAIIALGLLLGLLVRHQLGKAAKYEAEYYRERRYVPPRRQSASYRARERAADQLARLRARDALARMQAREGQRRHG